MDTPQPLISSDGSSNRNPPERCPRPLYSRDFMGEHHKIRRCYQYKKLKHIKTEVKEEVEEPYVRSNKLCKVDEIPPEISTDRRDTPRDVKAEEEEGGMKIKEEEIPPEISTDSRDTKATQRRFKAEEEEKQVKCKRKILEIGMDGRYRWYNMEKHPKSPDGDIVDDDITAYVAEEKAGTPDPQPVPYKTEKPFSCPDCGKGFTHESYLIIHHRSHTGEKPFVCPECGKRFTYKCSLAQHLAAHTAVWAFPCPECGKRFRTGWILAAHRKLHSSKDIQR